MRLEQNQGKGSAVRTGLAHAKGLITIIQDADLEYDPKEILKVIAPLQRKEIQVCLGSRYLHFERKNRGFVRPSFRLEVSILNQLSRVLFRQKLTDQATCYKAMPTEL